MRQIKGCLQAEPCGYSAAVRKILVLLALAGLAQAQLAGQADTPRTRMEAQLERVVRAFKGQMGVAAIDVRTGETIAVNADTRFPTASTIKTAVMVEAWQQVQDQRLAMDTTLRLEESAKVGGSGVLRGLHAGLTLTIADLIHLMIVLSDNTATNMLIGRLGTAHVNERLDAYGLKETKLFRPTFRDGRPDVLPDLEREFGLGMTTPRDMARLMVLIASGKAVSTDASAAMLATLRRQQDRAMIPRLIHNEDGVEIGNKTGTDEEKHALADGVKRHVRADAAIVSGQNFTYAIAIYARQVEDRQWGIDNDALTTGASISRTIFEYFSKPR